MKANLLISVEGIDEYSSELELELRIPEVRGKALFSKEIIDDYDEFLSALDDVINEAFIWRKALTGIKLMVGQSVYEFIEGKEEEIEKYIKHLVVEM